MIGTPIRILRPRWNTTIWGKGATIIADARDIAGRTDFEARMVDFTSAGQTTPQPSTIHIEPSEFEVVTWRTGMRVAYWNNDGDGRSDWNGDPATIIELLLDGARIQWDWPHSDFRNWEPNPANIIPILIPRDLRPLVATTHSAWPS